MRLEDVSSDEDCAKVEAQRPAKPPLRAVDSVVLARSSAAAAHNHNHNHSVSSATPIQASHSHHCHHHQTVLSIPAMEVAVQNTSLFSTAINNAAALVEPLEFYVQRQNQKHQVFVVLLPRLYYSLRV